MARVVTVARGDSISKILADKRGVKTHEIYAWLNRVGRLNPHIGSLDRIWPGDLLLIPDNVIELVSERQIWENAFLRIPSDLKRPLCGHITLYLTGMGETIDAISEKMFSEGLHGKLPASTKRAVLLANNLNLKPHLDKKHLPPNILVNITPTKLDKFDACFWQGEQQVFRSYLDQFDPLTRDMYQAVGPDDTFILAKMVEALQEAGASVGLKDVVNGLGYGVGGWSGLAVGGNMAVNHINTLLREIYAEAVEKFGPKMVVSKKASHLAQMTNFIKSNPKYAQLMRSVNELPQALLPMPRHKLVPPTSSTVDSVLARHFRKQYWQAFQNRPSVNYMGTIARQLDGRLSFLKGLGRHATWYIPAVLGLVNVATASQELRMRTLFEEGFGVVGGYLGTELGAAFGGWIAISVLGLGPFGLFVTVFFLAAGIGIMGNMAGKGFGSQTFDLGDRLGSSICHSPDELIGAFNE